MLSWMTNSSKLPANLLRWSLQMSLLPNIFLLLLLKKITPIMASLKDAKAVIEEGGCIVWGQLLDVPYKFDKLGLGYANGIQKNDPSPRFGGLMSHFISQGVNAIEDDGMILNHIIRQYPNEVPPVSMEVWDT